MNGKTFTRCAVIITASLSVASHAAFTCTEIGLYADPDSNNCSRYILCKPESVGALSSVHLRNCPENTRFNPFHRKCDSFYNCDGIDPHDGVDPCHNYNFDYPIIPNPYDNSAASYIFCEYFDDVTHGAKGGILKTFCPKDTFFSPYVKRCYHNYDPNETCSKDACSRGPGQYVNYKSGNCESYIDCRDKGFRLYEPVYDIRYCPEGTRFNPETRKCRKNYECPAFPENYCYVQTTTSATTTTTSAATTRTFSE